MSTRPEECGYCGTDHGSGEPCPELDGKPKGANVDELYEPLTKIYRKLDSLRELATDPSLTEEVRSRLRAIETGLRAYVDEVADEAELEIDEWDDDLDDWDGDDEEWDDDEDDEDDSDLDE